MRSAMILAVVGMATAANAAVVTQWNFNSPVADANTATGTLTPNIGAGTASVISVTGSFASGDASGGSTDPNVGDDSGWGTTGYAAQGTGSGTRGTQYLSSTAGVLDGLYVTFDVRHSNTSSRYLQFEYTLDGGTSWSSAGLSLNGAPGSGLLEHIGGDTGCTNQRFDLFDVPAASNNANFGFRVTAVFAPSTSGYLSANPANSYATSGTLRYDMVTVSTPAPGAAALLGLGGLLMARRRR